MDPHSDLSTLLNRSGHTLIHCEVGAQLFPLSGSYKEFVTLGRWMTREQSYIGEPLLALYIDIEEAGSSDKESYKLETGTAGQAQYTSVIQGALGSSLRFRTSLINPVTSFDQGTSRSLRLVRPLVGFRDLESEWTHAVALDSLKNDMLFEKALRFLFDRQRARPRLRVKITIPGMEATEYTRGTRLDRAILERFAMLTQAPRNEKEGKKIDYPAVIVVEDLEDLALSSSGPAIACDTSTEATASNTSTAANPSDASTETGPPNASAEANVTNDVPSTGREAPRSSTKQGSPANERPRLPQTPDPLLERWAQPNVQMLHRVLQKGFCTHVREAEQASTGSNTRFRTQREDCLICGSFISPNTEQGVRKHYKEHRTELAILKARSGGYAVHTTPRTPTSGLDSDVHLDNQQATAQSQHLQEILARLQKNTPQQAAGPQQDVESNNTNTNPALEHQQPALIQASPPATSSGQDTGFHNANIDPALRQPRSLVQESAPPSPAHLTCIFCQLVLPSSAIGVAQHYYTHEEELNRLRLDLERAETQVGALGTTSTEQPATARKPNNNAMTPKLERPKALRRQQKWSKTATRR